MQNRAARIYPLYFLLTALSLGIGTLYAYDYAMQLWQRYSLLTKAVVVFLNLTFLRGFFEEFCWMGISQAWSLMVEEAFYVFAPFILWTVSGRPLRLVWWTLGLLSTGLILGQIFGAHAGLLHGLFGSKTFVFEWTFFGHSFGFTSGIALALWVAQRGTAEQNSAWATWGGIAWLVGVAMLIATLERRNLPITPEHLEILLKNFVLPPGICLLLLGLLRERTGVRRLLETRVFDLLGKSSYAFYLIHLGILSVVLTRLGWPLLVNFSIMVGLSIALYKLVEEPLQVYFKSLQFGKEDAAPAVESALAAGTASSVVPHS